MAQIRPLNNDKIHEPINSDLTSDLLHDNSRSVNPKKCKPVMICSVCFVLAALIIIVATVTVVVSFSLNGSHTTMTESDTTNANAPGITTVQETTRSAVITIVSDTTQGTIETCKCLFNKNISERVSLRVFSESPSYVFNSAS